MLQKWGNTSILFLMACEAEYGECLKTCIKPVFVGVGPVEAAISTTKILTKLQNDHNLPDLIVSIGSAGSAKLLQTAIYQVSEISYRDMDAKALGFEVGVTPFLNLPAKLAMPLFLPHLPHATLSTGGNVVSGKAYDTIDADMVDMETYAICRAAQTFNVKVFGLRGISDGKDDLKHIMDWQQYLHIIDEKLATILINLREIMINTYKDTK